MAKIQEELIVFKLSKLVKDTADITNPLANADVVAGLEQVAQELVGNDVIVELIKE
jgi:hypothetical protein